MKCACGKPDCENEIWVDAGSGKNGIICTEKVITLNGNKAHESTLIYLDVETIDELIKQLTEARNNAY